MEEWQNADPVTQDPVTQDDVRTTASGRMTAIDFDPNNANVMYVATAGSGVWKSMNKGAGFTSITSSRVEFSFASLAVDPTNSNIVYAGTCDISGYYGNGLLKSTDGGSTWTLLGMAAFGANAVTAVIVHPTNGSRLYVATGSATQFGFKTQLPDKAVFRS